MNLGIKIKTRDPWRVQECLSRMGIGRLSDSTLWPSCHLIKSGNDFYIMHFKEAMMMEGSKANFVEGDIPRRNKIVALLQEWNLLTVCEGQDISDQIENVFYLKAHQTKDWNIRPKYYPINKNNNEDK